MSILLSLSATEQVSNKFMRFYMGSLDDPPVFFPARQILSSVPTAVRNDSVQNSFPLGGAGQPFKARNGALYCALAIPGPGPIDTKLVMRSSTDGGANWFTVGLLSTPPTIPGASGQQVFAYSSFVDLAKDNIIFCYPTVSAPTPLQYHFKNFDIVHETWGPIYGGSSPILHGALGPIFKRDSRNDLVMIFSTSQFDVSAPYTSRLTGVAYDLAFNTWGPIFDPGANISVRPNYSGQPGASTFYMDANDDIGMFVQWFSFNNTPIQWDKRIFYQQVHPNNSLGSFHDFPEQQFPLATQVLFAPSGNIIGDPIILTVQDKIVLPVSVHVPNPPDALQNKSLMTFMTGTPVANPTVWTLGPDGTQGGIDLAVLLDTLLANTSSAVSCQESDGTLNFVWLCHAANGASQGRLRRATTKTLSNLSAVEPTTVPGWKAATIFDMSINVQANFYPPHLGQSQGLGGLNVSAPVTITGSKTKHIVY